MYSQVVTIRLLALIVFMSPQAMMQPTITSQVASTQRWMTHHHQYLFRGYGDAPGRTQVIRNRFAQAVEAGGIDVFGQIVAGQTQLLGG